MIFLVFVNQCVRLIRAMNKDSLILVGGAGGFIGGHLVGHLLNEGYTRVRAVDCKPLRGWYQIHEAAESLRLDLQEKGACFRSVEGVSHIFNLACDMGGMGFIENNKALCMLSVLINTHLLMAAKELGCASYFYSSSACVYAAGKQTRPDISALAESDAYPAMPEDGYGWEKLFSERMCRHFKEDFGIETTMARYHNIYGPHGTYDGGREKAPAAMCRKIIEAKLSGNHELEIWGDGEQTRSFTYIDDCIKGTMLVVENAIPEPVNVGSSEMVTINQLADIVEDIAGIELKRNYNLDAPLGVRGRNSDNTLIRKYLGWEPSTSLRDGMETTYRWIYDQIVSGSADKACNNPALEEVS